MQDMPDQIQRMLDFYGLAKDPFGEQVDATVFSNAGERSDIAEQLKHLLTFSPQDCLLMAPAGGGKSALAHQLIKRLDDEWRVAWLNVADAPQLDTLIRELIGQLGLGLRVDGDLASLLRTVVDVIRQRTEDGEYFLLIVQHADQLSPDVQQWLQSLRTLSPKPDCRLRQLWMAGSATAIEQADNDDVWYGLVLEPFSATDALTYLKDRFAGAGQLEGVPIEAKDVARLNDLARGLPGELNQVVKDYLIAGTFKTTERRQGFPLTHVLAGAGVVTLIVVAVLYGRQTEPESVSIATNPPVNSAPLADNSEVQQRLAEAAARIEARRQETKEQETATSAPPLEPEIKPARQVPVSPVVQEEEQAPSSVEEAVPLETEPKDEVTPTPASAGRDSSSSPGAVTSTGMMATAADTEYTLQLLGVRERSAIESLVSTLSNRDRFEIVDSTYQGKPWYVLIHGRYKDSAAARADIKNLPEAFADQSPWPRTFANLRASSPGK